MATYAMTINEHSIQGKALLNYLGELNLKLVPISKSSIQAPCQFSKKEMREILTQSAEEARNLEGTSHEDFKKEIASWL